MDRIRVLTTSSVICRKIGNSVESMGNHATNLLQAIRRVEEIIADAGVHGETVFTCEVVKTIREEHPECRLSSGDLTELVMGVSVECGVPVLIEAPFEVLWQELETRAAC